MHDQSYYNTFWIAYLLVALTQCGQYDTDGKVSIYLFYPKKYTRRKRECNMNVIWFFLNFNVEYIQDMER